MSDVTPEPSEGGSFFSKKISGIKTGYLVFGGLGLALLFYYWNKRKGASPVPVSTIDTSGSAANTVSSGTGTAGGSPMTGAAIAPPTNAAWARGALNAAIGNGTVNATDGANAVSTFLNGQPLTPSQADIIGKLTTAYGQPPEGVLPITTATSGLIDNQPTRYVRNAEGQISAQTANGSAYVITLPEWQALAAQGATYTQMTDTAYSSSTHNYFVMPGDTPQAVSTRFYGTPDKASLLPATLTPGQTIKLPTG